MTEMHLIGESLRLLVIGMGIVFLFLLLLVALLRAMSWIAQRLAPPEPEPLAPPLADSASDDDIVAAIAAAITRWRSTHRPRR